LLPLRTMLLSIVTPFHPIPVGAQTMSIYIRFHPFLNQKQAWDERQARPDSQEKRRRPAKPNVQVEGLLSGLRRMGETELLG
jgi:hypothetical protein